MIGGVYVLFLFIRRPGRRPLARFRFRNIRTILDLCIFAFEESRTLACFN